MEELKLDDLVNEDIPNSIKIVIIRNELSAWLNTRYTLRLRHRVNKSINPDDTNTLDRITEELVKCEKAIDMLTKDLKTFDKE
jgi:hypothetical protein